MSLFAEENLFYSMAGNGNMTARIKPEGVVTDIKAPIITSHDLLDTASMLNSRAVTYLLRATTGTIDFSTGYVEQCAAPSKTDPLCAKLAMTAISIKRYFVRRNTREWEYDIHTLRNTPQMLESDLLAGSLLATVDGINEKRVLQRYGFDERVAADIITDTGTPAGYYPLITGYDTMPESLVETELPMLTQDITDALVAHERHSAALSDLARIKLRLRTFYEAGPGVSTSSDEAAGNNESSGGIGDDGDDDAVSEAHVRIPTETFLEEISQKLEVHPISVWNLLQEIRAEGARCKPEEQRLLEDRLSIIVLLLLGHRWPKQLEAGEPVPRWADQDGIIPFQACTGEIALADRVRERLRAEDGDLGVQQAEALLGELTGQDLETWLRRTFFPRHVRQFKYRPIAWHLASTPVAVGAAKGKSNKGRGGSRQAPAFECMVYYHACGLGLLARLRTQYVEPLLRAERGRVEAARQAGDDTAAARATAHAQELEAFMERLRGVEERGFDTPDLQKMLSDEPVDRWSGDGILAPVSCDALLAQERTWAVDINDGVRVNIAPLQLVGVLASDVLKEADAKKVLADRARWRADERRWVREGVLPRCGWMSEDIPASPRWVERAPEREAEQRKVEQKRAEAMARLAQGDGGDE